MSDPFLVDGPAMVSFSGGRTSAYMLRRILDAGLRRDVHVLFANTGKEREETLDFVRDVGERWGVPVHWLERDDDGEFVEVDYASASREGEPFDALIVERNYLPNPVMRFCTQELKIRVMKGWMMARGFDHWTNVVGIRADEPRRVAKLRAPNKERWEVAMPLVDAGVSLAEVEAFWAGQSFDLRLKPHEGNCDLCFLKGTAKRKRIMRERPDLARWWIDTELRAGAPFRADTPSYRALLKAAQSQVEMFPDAELDALADCVCTG